MKATKKAVRVWMLGVMAKQRVTMGVNECEDQISLAAPAFIARFPAEAFCTDSMDHVAAACRYWGEADVTKALQAWWDRANPDKTGLPIEVQAAPLDATGKHWAAGWFRAETERDGIRALHLMATTPTAQDAYAWLLRISVRAADIAIGRGWPDPNRYSRAALAAEWGDPDTVEAGVRSCLGYYSDGSRGFPDGEQVARALSTLSAIVGMHAPQNLHLIPSAETINGGQSHAHAHIHHGEIESGAGWLLG